MIQIHAMSHERSQRLRPNETNALIQIYDAGTERQLDKRAGWAEVITIQREMSPEDVVQIYDHVEHWARTGIEDVVVVDASDTRACLAICQAMCERLPGARQTLWDSQNTLLADPNVLEMMRLHAGYKRSEPGQEKS